MTNKLKTFQPNKNVEELEIDPSRKFVVVEGNRTHSEWDILTLCEDDWSNCPYFDNETTNKKCLSMYWCRLAYADSKPTKTEKPTYTKVFERNDWIRFTETHIWEESIEDLKADIKRINWLLTEHRDLFFYIK